MWSLGREGSCAAGKTWADGSRVGPNATNVDRGSVLLNPLKTELSEFFGVSKDALHVHLGLLAFVLAVVLLRKPLASVLPWLCVLALESLNEILDFLRWHNLPDYFAGTLKDVLNTMVWPTVFLLSARFVTLRRHPRSDLRETPPSTDGTQGPTSQGVDRTTKRRL